MLSPANAPWIDPPEVGDLDFLVGKSLYK